MQCTCRRCELVVCEHDWTYPVSNWDHRRRRKSDSPPLWEYEILLLGSWRVATILLGRQEETEQQQEPQHRCSRITQPMSCTVVCSARLLP